MQQSNDKIAILLIYLIAAQANAQTSKTQTRDKNVVRTVIEGLAETKKTGELELECSPFLSEKESLDLLQMLQQLNSNLDKVISPDNKNKYEVPSLQIDALNSSQNSDLNKMLKITRDFALNVQEKGLDSEYTIPTIKINSLTEEENRTLNTRFKDEIESAIVRPGTEAGVLGVTFVIVVGTILGVTLSDSEGDIDIPPDLIGPNLLEDPNMPRYVNDNLRPLSYDRTINVLRASPSINR